MSEKPINAVAVIGIDIGKNSFHVVGLDQRGAIVLRQKWSRSQVEARFANMPPCLVHRPRSAFLSAFKLSTYYSVDVAHGLVLLFGIGTSALPLWDSKTRWNDLLVGLAVKRTAGPSGHANSPHPSSRKGHHSTTRWSSSFLLSGLILAAHAAEASRAHRNSVPSTQMRCMITASRRASATTAFFIPRRLAICIAQALSHDHFFERSML